MLVVRLRVVGIRSQNEDLGWFHCAPVCRYIRMFQILQSIFRPLLQTHVWFNLGWVQNVQIKCQYEKNQCRKCRTPQQAGYSSNLNWNTRITLLHSLFFCDDTGSTLAKEIRQVRHLLPIVSCFTYIYVASYLIGYSSSF